MAKEWLQQRGISFTEYNVAADMRRAEEMVRKSGQMSVPVIDIDGKIIVGFNKPEIEKYLHHWVELLHYLEHGIKSRILLLEFRSGEDFEAIQIGGNPE